MSDPAPYKYNALQSRRSIRIIGLEGTSRRIFRRSKSTHAMEIELKEVSLDSSPSYEALSYTWDGQQPDRHITCKAGTLQVTQNCERALFRLRDSTKRWLWIDSICINQASTAEKNTQIPLMGEIYGKAENVLVWLGPGSKASDETFQYLEDISNLAAPILASQTWRATMNSKDVQEVQIMQQISIPDSIRKTVLSRKTGFEGMDAS